MTIEPLPGSDEDRLVVHLLGSGYGESQIVLFPGAERRCVVVDSCMSKRGGRNLTAELLRKLKRKPIDLLVVTHADADHIEGMPALIDEFEPALVWYSPFLASLRALVAQWRRTDPKNKGYIELEALHQRIKRLREQDRAEMVLWNSRPWDCQPDGCVVEPIAPVSEDDAVLSSKMSKMLKREEGKGWIVTNDGGAVLDGKKAAGDKPNALSIALAIRWGRRRVLLAGDVEKTHWSKALRKLERSRPPRIDLVRAVDVVKVAHHGSDGAYHEGAWAEHRKDDGSTIALVAPFDDTVKLPHLETLGHLMSHAGCLGLTTDAGGGFARAEEAGWIAMPEAALVPLADAEVLVTVALAQDGSTEIRASRDARFLVLPPARVWWSKLDEPL